MKVLTFGKVSKDIYKHFAWLIYLLPFIVSSYRRVQSRLMLERINQRLVNITYSHPAIYTQLALPSKSLTGKKSKNRTDELHVC